MIKTYKGQGKSYLIEAKCYKKIAITWIGWLGWILATPKTKAILITMAEDLINEITNKIENEE